MVWSKLVEEVESWRLRVRYEERVALVCNTVSSRVLTGDMPLHRGAGGAGSHGRLDG